MSTTNIQFADGSVANKKTKRKIGAQPGHTQHLRKPIAPDLVDKIVRLALSNCPDCGQKLDLDKIEPKAAV